MEEYICDIKFKTKNMTGLELSHLLKQYGLKNAFLEEILGEDRIMTCISSKEKIDNFKDQVDDIVRDFYPDIYSISVTIRSKKSPNLKYEDYKKMSKELDTKLMGQFVVESMTNDLSYIPYSEPSEMPLVALSQMQYIRFCLQSKANITMDNVQKNTQTTIITALKDYICKYASKDENRYNPKMNSLYDSDDFYRIVERICYLSLFSIYKDIDKLLPMPKHLLTRSLDPERVSTAISLYVYFTILTNKYFDDSDYNRLYVESWFEYFNNWMIRLSRLQELGITWKDVFAGVLLAD